MACAAVRGKASSASLVQMMLKANAPGRCQSGRVVNRRRLVVVCARSDVPVPAPAATSRRESLLGVASVLSLASLPVRPARAEDAIEVASSSSGAPASSGSSARKVRPSSSHNHLRSARNSCRSSPGVAHITSCTLQAYFEIKVEGPQGRLGRITASGRDNWCVQWCC